LSRKILEIEISEKAHKSPITPLPAGRQGLGSVAMTLLKASCPLDREAEASPTHLRISDLKNRTFLLWLDRFEKGS
jgi:hypothetical protein